MIVNMKWLQILFLTTLFGPVSAWSSESSDWQLVYSSNLHGELKPCGCSPEGNLGGMLRRASKLDQLRQRRKTITVSIGDLLDEPNEQGTIKNRYIVKGMEKLRLDAILPGETELAHVDFEKLNLPWVLSNSTSYSNIPQYRKIQLGNGRLVIIVGVLEPALASKTGIVLEDATEALRRIIRDLQAKPMDSIIVLAHGSELWTRNISRIKRVNIIVRGHLLKKTDGTSSHGEHVQPILAAGYRGQNIGLARFKSETGKMVANQIIALPKSVPDHPEFSHLYAQYDADVVIWFRARTLAMKNKASNRTHVFASASVCKQCHQQEYTIWHSTRHANAYNTLTRVKKNEDPECLLCHTTGMGNVDGFVSSSVTPELVNVQCESCHGAARKHAAYPVVHQPWKAMSHCRNCHTPENSPAFDLVSYGKKIVHTRKKNIPIHRQSISAIKGIYDLTSPGKPVLGRAPVQVTEYFNFYCSRCYQLNKSWPDVFEFLQKPVKHKQVPIIFGDDQKPWASIAYLVAETRGKGPEFKNSIFKAKFEDDIDIDDKHEVIRLAAKFGLATPVRQALASPESGAAIQYQKGMQTKRRKNIAVTPTIFINNNLAILPRHTGNNTQLLVENVREILLDMQCRQHHACDL